jgi:hypothetical protein
MLVLASVAVSFFSVRLKAALHILAGMAVGLASEVATGALFGSRELGGKLAWQLMCCGGIWVRFATSDTRGIPVPHHRANTGETSLLNS